MNLDYLAGVLYAKSAFHEIRVSVPTTKSVWSDELRYDPGQSSHAEFLAELFAAEGSIPPYLQIMGLDENKPGFVFVALPNGRKPRVLLAGPTWSFKLTDLSFL